MIVLQDCNMCDIPKMVTNQIILRPLVPEDYLGLWQVYMNLDGVECSPHPHPILPNPQRVLDFISIQQAHWDVHGFGIWGIVPQGSQELVGWAGLQYLHETEEVEVGFLMEPVCWGKGFATGAVRASINYGFKTFSFTEIISRVHPENFAIQSVLQKCGMHRVNRVQSENQELIRYRLCRETYQMLEWSDGFICCN